MEIRPARPADAAAVTALVHDAYAHYVARLGRRPAPMDVDYAAAIDSGGVWVAEADGAMVGVLVLVVEADHLLLENIAVSPAAQGTGLGTRLLEFTEAQARAHGRPEVRLYTNEKMTENIAYYGRHGFHETHRVADQGFRRVFFAKNLTE